MSALDFPAAALMKRWLITIASSSVMVGGRLRPAGNAARVTRDRMFKARERSASSAATRRSAAASSWVSMMA